MASIKGCVLKNTIAPTGQTGFGTASPLQWANNLYDTDSFHAGTDGKITIPSVHNGKYGIFTGCVSQTSGTSLGDGSLWSRFQLVKNGSASFNGAAGQYTIVVQNGQAATNGWTSFVSGAVPLATGDAFELYWRTNSAPAPGLTISTESSFGLLIIDDLSSVTQRTLAKLNADKTTQNYSTPTFITWDGTDVYDTDNVHDP